MNKISTIILCVFLLVLFCTPLLWAAETDIADTIQEQYASIQSFRTQFEQDLTNAASGETEERNGTIWFQKPHRIRWQTEHPDKELLVSNNNTVWDYFPEDKVANKYSLQGRFESKTMLRFISGEVNIKEDFQVLNQGPDPMHSDWIKLRLVPKDPEPSLVMAYLWFEEQSNLIRQVLLVDFFGNGNQLTFQDIEQNIEIDPSLFCFQPPEDVQLMKEGESGDLDFSCAKANSEISFLRQSAQKNVF